MFLTFLAPPVFEGNYEMNMGPINLLWVTQLLRVHNEQFLEEKGFILRDTEKEV